jgi:glycerol-3-phosphate dehydrogenase
VQDVYDLAIIGGGINGCGLRAMPRAAASVVLCEMGDLAPARRRARPSSSMAGLRYLEHFDFRLVREALAEREVLWGIAPHIVRPMRFVLPHQQGLRPAWMLRVGLFMYDHLGGRQRLPWHACAWIWSRTGPALRSSPAPSPPPSNTPTAGSTTPPGRLNAADAARRGAHIRVRTRVLGAVHTGDAWSLSVQEAGAARTETIAARVLVNAAGPWVANVADLLASGTAHKVRLVQGSHIVVRKLFTHDRAYLFQNPDGRVVFAIPYEGDFTLIGTTDRDFIGNPAAGAISREEIDYLCATASAASRSRSAARCRVVLLRRAAALRRRAGEAKAASREYVLEMDEPPGSPPCWRSSAARSPPTAAWPRPRWSVWPAPAGAAGAPAGLDRRSAAAGRRIRTGRVRAAGGCAGARLPVPGRRATHVAWRTPTARRPGACSARHGRRGSRQSFGATLTRPRCAT